MKKFSIIIPAYNCADTIERLLGSLVIQKDKIHEVILCDDRSTDNTVDIAKLYDQILPIKFVRVSDDLEHGPGNARQAGLDIATGDWVIFCDADDILSFTALDFFDTKTDEHPDAKVIAGSFDEVQLSPFFVYDHHFGAFAWVHGKCFNRRFLVEHNIRFPKNQFTHEDKYLLGVCLAEMAIAKEDPIVEDYLVYYWVARPDSIVHSGRYLLDSHCEAMMSGIEPILLTVAAHGLTKEEVTETFGYDLVRLIGEIYAKTQCFRHTYGDEILEERGITANAHMIYRIVRDLTVLTKNDIFTMLQADPNMLQEFRADSIRTLGQYIERQSFYDFVENLEKDYNDGTTTS